MSHYEVKSQHAESIMRRRFVVAEINSLRKFEGRSLTDNRIERELGKLHKLWFKGRRIE